MNKYFRIPVIVISVFCLLAFSGVHNKAGCPGIVMLRQNDTGLLQITIDPEKEFQTIHSFGASDCWTAKYTGQWKDDRKKNAIADLLFSTENRADGSPNGIGLSLWRFNIGAGSYEQGVASGIHDDYRREECFLDAAGKYNWQKEAGAQWFLKAAKQRGVQYLLGFTNSAPVQFTQNKQAYGLSSNHWSCRADKYNDFAGFLVEVAKYFKQRGTPLDYISPVNEPQWKWGEHPNQEGSGSTNEETAAFIKILGPKLKAAAVASRITVGEAAQVNFLYEPNKNYTGNQLDDYFNPVANNYLGAVPNMEKLISYHSYFTTCPDTTLFSYRQSVNAKRQSVDPAVQLWQSEFGVLGSICGRLNGGPRNTGIGYGLYVAKVMYADLTIAGVTSFQWWLAINPYDYSDGLVYINAPDGSINPAKSKEDGLVSSSKQLWCMGNYSRFIRPGMKRVAVSLAGSSNLLVSSWKNSSRKELVTVIVNDAAGAVAVQLHALGHTLKSMPDMYITAADQDLQHSTTETNSLQLQPMSVTTVVTKYE